MKSFSLFRLLLLLVFTAAATACKKDSDSATSLDGQWRLTERQCYCPRTAVPDETVTFQGSSFAFYQNNRLVRRGTFSHVNTADLCGITSQVPALRFVLDEATPTTQTVGVHLDGNTLVLDYGSPCDAPRDTYQRME
jgi:hypothetical protein